ncbi:copper chaperone PCu(A)C [Litorivivens sp.]|uniref:copper chaperone PCu(A)C n=1 Tax=Litorivivens sp. TaxID=2020868 RepID=UPI003567C959
MFKRVLLFFLILTVLPVSAVEFHQAYVRGLPPTQSATAAFFRVSNPDAEAWTLTAVYSDIAESVEIHEHVHSAGMMQMRQRKSLTVPAGGEVVFKPGGLHLMLIGLKQPLREGQEVALCFENDKGDITSVTFPVVSVINEHRHH